MIAWKATRESYITFELIRPDYGVYAFTKKKTADWYNKEYFKKKGMVVKIWGCDKINRKKSHPDERVFKEAVILHKYLIPPPRQG